MQLSLTDIITTAPLTIIAISALAVLVLESLMRDGEPSAFWSSIIGFIAALVASIAGIDSEGLAYNGLVTTGGYANFCSALFCLAGILTLLVARPYLSSRTEDRGEHYSLILLSVVGMILMASAADLIVLFLGLELMSIAFYVLAGFVRTSSISIESSLKYFLLGAFATGFLLYGIALLYGATGTTRIEDIVAAGTAAHRGTLYLIGLALLLIGFVFKIAAVPFHMWVPDVYEGAPTTVTGFMSTGGKAAGFAAFLLVFGPKLLSSAENVRDVIAVIAALSMLVGNIFALAQDSVKRMLAYSSIAHAGYILTGLVAANTVGGTGVLFYIVAYTAMNIGTFGVVALLENEKGSPLFDDYAGLSSRYPFLAGLMALFMFSLTGIPPFAGFFAKYYVFTGAISAGYTWLAILGVVTSLVSVYYYLRLVVLMYFQPMVHEQTAQRSRLGLIAVTASAMIVLSLGLLPSSIVELASRFF